MGRNKHGFGVPPTMFLTELLAYWLSFSWFDDFVIVAHSTWSLLGTHCCFYSDFQLIDMGQYYISRAVENAAATFPKNLRNTSKDTTTLSLLFTTSLILLKQSHVRFQSCLSAPDHVDVTKRCKFQLVISTFNPYETIKMILLTCY